jgi:hypothetical protein
MALYVHKYDIIHIYRGYYPYINMSHIRAIELNDFLVAMDLMMKRGNDNI